MLHCHIFSEKLWTRGMRENSMRFLPRMVPCSLMNWVWLLQACIYRYVSKNNPKLVQSGIPARCTNILSKHIVDYITTRLILLSIIYIMRGELGEI